MTVGIFYNEKQVTLSVVERFVSRIRECGCRAVVFAEKEQISGCDRLLVLGGDGTILHSAQKAAELQIPILGVNYGTRGFLAEFERDEIDESTSFVTGENYALVQRSMLEATFGGKTVHCLNEFTLFRNPLEQSSDSAVAISLEIDDNFAGKFISDGLIVSTPTGSTAYSLSAGGSIMTPDCETFLLTSVCASSLRSRPIVCPDKCVFRLSAEENNVSLILHGDGKYFGEAQKGDSIVIKKSDRRTTFMTKDKSEFFRRLTKKIN